MGEFVLKRRKNVRIHELLSNTTAYAHNLNVMLGVTRNSVVQQHLRVVQELQLLSLVVLSYYYHEMNFGKRSIKKPTVLLVGLGGHLASLFRHDFVLHRSLMPDFPSRNYPPKLNHRNSSKDAARRRLGYVTYALLYCESRSLFSYTSCALLYVATPPARNE